LHFSNDKVAALRSGDILDINEEGDCENILPIVKKNRNIKKAEIWGNITEDSLNLIVDSIVKKKIRPHVIRFCNYDFFSDENIEFLIRLFNNNKDLRIILGNQIRYNSLLTSVGTEKLHQALIFNKTLFLLDLSNNNIGPGGSKFIAAMIKDCKSLQHLLLENNNIGNEGVKLVAEALKVENIIEKITLDMNNISDIGLAYIGETIRVNDALRFLTLDDNFITDEGLKMFANALATNYSLISVHFKNNLFTRECISYLLDMLNPNN
jgi:Ran GTPase-activating protein (RanGAP) involved in mRNA processing and transport